MEHLIFYVSLLILSVLSQQQKQLCKPFGVRLALGKRFYSQIGFYSQIETQIMSVRFNTNNLCQSSFLYVQNQRVQRRVRCLTKKIGFKKYITYIHICSIDFLNEGENFQYQVYGWNGKKSGQIISYKNEFIKVKILKRDELSTKVLVLADWGDQDKYQKLDSAFNSLQRSNNQPDAVFLNGDYAYDLSSNNGKNYQVFLKMLQLICPFWPCIFNIGNHQHNSPADMFLFNNSFQNYDLANNRVTSLNMGAFTLLISDPFNVIYGDQSKQDFIDLNIQHIKKANKNIPIIAATHYHMACGGGCSKNKEQYQLINVFKQLLDTFIDNDVILYLGAHVHSYQRYYPYTKSGQFKFIQSPYKFNKNSKYLISVVEGVGGNDQAMSKYKNVSEIIKAVHPKATGYGVLTVNDNNLIFQHYLAKAYQKPADSFQINFSELIHKNKNIREQIVLHNDKDQKK